MLHRHPPPPARRRPAGVLVEFALIFLTLYLLLAAIFEMGRALYSSQSLQETADVAARELSHTPLPAAISFEDALQYKSPDGTVNVPATIYNDELLILDPATPVGNLPLVNQMLYNLMFLDTVTLNGSQQTVLRYPGAILKKPNGAFTVGIPVVTVRDATGTETIQWSAVVEEIKPSDGSTPPFSITSAQRGVVALRINYAYQAASLSAYQDGAPGPQGDPQQLPIQANDGGVQAVNAPPDGGTPVDPGQAVGPYAGAFGLGRQYAVVKTVRPFRRVLSAQAIFRREVFQ